MIVHAQQQTISISDGIDVSPTSYTIIYSDFSTSSICGLSTNLDYTCQGGLTYDTFNFSPPCSSNGYTSVSVFATNIFGRGPFSHPLVFRIKSDKCGKLILGTVNAHSYILLLY